VPTLSSGAETNVLRALRKVGAERRFMMWAGGDLVPDTWTPDGEGALLELGPCPHDNSCVGCRGTEMATSRFFGVEFDDVAEIWDIIILNVVFFLFLLTINAF